MQTTRPIAVTGLVANWETEGYMKTEKENIMFWPPGGSLLFFWIRQVTKDYGSVDFLHFKGLLPLSVQVAGESSMLMPSKMYRCDFSSYYHLRKKT